MTFVRSLKIKKELMIYKIVSSFFSYFFKNHKILKHFTVFYIAQFCVIFYRKENVK